MLAENPVALSVAYTVWHHSTGQPMVIVSLGDTEVAVLTPCRKTRAGHGDDSSYFASEERAIAEETVAPYLRRLFEQAGTENE